jgi:hypothetical protein
VHWSLGLSATALCVGTLLAARFGRQRVTAVWDLTSPPRDRQDRP